MSYKILLADDSITVQKIVTLTFSDEGVDVVPVNNGDEAIRRLQSLRPALVMADVSIPGKNGYEICAYIKSQPELRNIPVILLVPAFEPFDDERAARVGADHHLTKPFQSIRTLIATVKGLIEPEKTAAPADPLELDWPSTNSRTDEIPVVEMQRQTAALSELPLAQDDIAVLAGKEPDTGDLAKPASKSGSIAHDIWPAPLPPLDPMRSTVELDPNAPPPSPVVAGSAPTSFSSMWEDDVLELDDVLPSLPPMIVMPPQTASLVPMNPATSGAITQSVKMTSVEAVTTIPSNIIDEIVSRVATQVTNQIAQQLAQQFSQFAARVSQDVVAQLAAAQPAQSPQVVRTPVNAPKRDAGDSLLDL